MKRILTVLLELIPPVVIFGGLVWLTLSELITGILLIIVWVAGFILATLIVSYIVVKVQKTNGE